MNIIIMNNLDQGNLNWGSHSLSFKRQLNFSFIKILQNIFSIEYLISFWLPENDNEFMKPVGRNILFSDVFVDLGYDRKLGR